ncbi:hypothetical protein [Paraburkholderia kururiensis]|uniref:Uncharacterized protein n=1 Tax=Paraburkholderia kururiensis TaxID=984307 RepID=A0ABZ0WFF6_9BURK|nr:hypothetical protein [Paraburkholderia kururiensis]WQD76055.1 hypothetical protein U0042_18265 [Paraburkholderia kururiensis]
MTFRQYTKKLFDDYDLVLSDIQLKSILGFERLFTEHPPKADTSGYEFVEIDSADSFDTIWRSRGMYMIASDFEPNLEKRDGCRLRIEGLPVIYRGQADLVRERVQSHLDNTRYVKTKDKKKQGTWTRCLKLDRKPGNGGIDCYVAPYQNYRWVVVVLPLRDSTTEFRNCAEWGFDAVFGKPIASNERVQGPSKSILDDARVRFAHDQPE